MSYIMRIAILSFFVNLTFVDYPYSSELNENINLSEEIYEDARKILDAKNGTVKRWEYPPQFVVVHDPRVDIKLVKNTIIDISVITGLQIKEPVFRILDKNEAGKSFYTKSIYRIKKNNLRKSLGQLEIHGDVVSRLRGNVFVFLVDPKYAAHFMVLTHFGYNSGQLERAYLLDPRACFFNVFSNSFGIHLGTIFISPLLNKNEISKCIHEEFFQVMGLFHDSPGSKKFNFDDLALNKPKIYDEKLLDSLYADKIRTGSNVSEVIEIFRSKLKLLE